MLTIHLSHKKTLRYKVTFFTPCNFSIGSSLSLSLWNGFFFWKRVSGNAEYTFLDHQKKLYDWKFCALNLKFPNFKFFKSNRIGLRHTNPHEKKNIFTHKLHLEPGYGNPPHTYDVPLNSSHFLHIHIWKRLVEFGVRRYVVWVGRGRSSLEGLFRRFSQSRTCVHTCLVGFESVFKTQKKVCIFFLSLYLNSLYCDSHECLSFYVNRRVRSREREKLRIALDWDDFILPGWYKHNSLFSNAHLHISINVSSWS